MNFLEHAKRAQEDEYTSIVNTHLDSIYSYCRFMVIDAEEAKDLTQKTFIAFLSNHKKMDESLPIKPWLYKVARNNCLDYLKKKKAWTFTETENEVLNVPDSAPDIEERLDDSLYLEKIKLLIEQLPSDVKEILLMKYFEDFTFEQIATATGLPENTVKSHFYRGKQKLFKLL